MKAIQITLDDALLARLDADEEYNVMAARQCSAGRLTNTSAAGANGRSPNLRPGYGRARGLREFEGWEHEGVWPEP